MKRALLLFIFLAAFASGLSAHEVRPAYLELRETAPETYDVLWKVPARGGNMRLSLQIEFPSDTNVTTSRTLFANEASTERWSVKRPNGLTGGTIHIAGLTATMTDVLVRMECLDGTTQVTRLTPSAPSFVVEPAPRALAVASTFTVLGIEHILLGLDHLLFVLGLLLIVDQRWGLLFKTITAFTLAHSITLALATLGFVHVPQAPVEAVIALSIMFVACEIIHQRQGQSGLTERWPWVVAFAFGLLHGFGFAGALSEVGLPQNHIPAALFFFNVGVEIGQLAFITVVLGFIALVRRIPLRVPRWAELIPPYAIGSIAMFSVVQRVATF
jgi:hypothetical protein